MNELIKVTQNEKGEQLVSARDLYYYLEVKKDFSDWIKTYIGQEVYGFEEGIDYSTFKGNSTKSTPRPKIEYIISINMAKELAMLSKVPKGKQARKYFIECERQLQTFKLPTTYKEALMALIQKEEEKEKLQLENKVKTQLIAEYEPKVSYYDSILSDKNSLLTITQIAKDYGLSGKSLNTILHTELIQYKQNGQWLLYSNYMNQGFTKSTTWDNGGKTGLHTKWTQKGRLFIHTLLEKNGIMAIMDNE